MLGHSSMASEGRQRLQTVGVTSQASSDHLPHLRLSALHRRHEHYAFELVHNGAARWKNVTLCHAGRFRVEHARMLIFSQP